MAGEIGLAFVDIVGDTSRTEQQVQRDMSRVIAVVGDSLNAVEVQAAVDAGTEQDLTRSINADIRAVTAAAQSVEVRADLSPETRADLRRQLRETAAALRASRSEIEVRVANRPIVESTVEAVVEAVAVAEAVAPSIEIEVDIDRDRLTRALAGVGSAAAGALPAVGRLGAGLLAAGAAAQSIGPLVGVLQAIGPAAAVAAPAVLSVGLAMGTVKLATMGVSDAITAAFDPKKAKDLTQQLKGLAPSAREFVLALQGLKPELKDIQQGAQQRFFAGFGDELQRLAKSVLPAVQAALFDTAGTFNLMGHSVADSVNALAANGTLGKALGGASQALRNLQGVPADLATSFGQLAAAAAPALDAITKAIAGKIEGVSTKIAAAFNSGELQKSISLAVDLIGDLGHVLANVGRIFTSVFSAGSASGGLLIQTLGKITDEMVKAFNSPAVQSGLQALFSTVATLSEVGMPLLGSALGVVAGALTAIAPGVKTLVSALGAGLQPIIKAMGPVLESAGQAITQLLFAVSPLLPVIGQLIAQLGPILVPILNTLAIEFQRAAPLIQEFATLLGSFLGPILQQIPTLIRPFLDAFTQMITLLFPVALQLLQELEPSIMQLSKAFVDVSTQLAPLLTQLFDLALQALQPLLPLIPPIIGLIGDLAAILAGELARQIQTIVVPALKGFSQLLNGDVDGAIHTFRDVSVAVAKEVAEQFILLPAKITTAFLGLGAKLFDIGNNIIGSLIKGMASKIPGMLEFLHEINKLIPDNKGPIEVDRKLLMPAGQAIMGGLIAGMHGERAALRSELAGVTAIVGSVGPTRSAVRSPLSVGSVGDQFAASASSASAGPSPWVTQVFIGDRELNDIVDTRIVTASQVQNRGIRMGTRN